MPLRAADPEFRMLTADMAELAGGSTNGRDGGASSFSNGINPQSNRRTMRQMPRARILLEDYATKCVSDCLSVKVDEIHNCESDYHCHQAKTEDVTDIVPGYARTSAFSIPRVGIDTPISLFIFRCYLVGHEILFSQATSMLMASHP
jgi:hypothetical protein